MVHKWIVFTFHSRRIGHFGERDGLGLAQQLNNSSLQDTRLGRDNQTDHTRSSTTSRVQLLDELSSLPQLLTKERRRDEAGQRQIIQQGLGRELYAHLDVLLGHILHHINNNNCDFSNPTAYHNRRDRAAHGLRGRHDGSCSSPFSIA